jgi:hypothetical protein
MKLLSPCTSWCDNRGNYVDCDNNDAPISNAETSIYMYLNNNNKNIDNNP